MNTPNPPETLGQSRSDTHAGTARNGTSVPVPAVPPPYRAEQQRNPGTNNSSWIAERAELSRRAAKLRPCPTCGAEILVGPDHDTCSLTARVDLEPVDKVTEVVALLRGRHSYDLAGLNLHHREPEHVHARRRPHPVLLEHTCTKGALW